MKAVLYISNFKTYKEAASFSNDLCAKGLEHRIVDTGDQFEVFWADIEEEVKQ